MAEKYIVIDTSGKEKTEEYQVGDFKATFIYNCTGEPEQWSIVFDEEDNGVYISKPNSPTSPSYLHFQSFRTYVTNTKSNKRCNIFSYEVWDNSGVIPESFIQNNNELVSTKNWGDSLTLIFMKYDNE